MYPSHWGLAQPIPGYQPVAWVPRPPRPGAVNLAAALAIIGIVVSGIEQVINLVYVYSNRDLMTNTINAQNPGQRAPLGLVNAAVDVGVGVSIVVWLLPVIGVIVTTVLTLRGANAARIVLASLMGVFVLDNVCGGVSGLVGLSVGTFRAGVGPTVAPYLQLLLAGLAIVIGVLVLLPSANQFFSAGAGRRFVPSN
jgi:hypothetical protein